MRCLQRAGVGVLNWCLRTIIETHSPTSGIDFEGVENNHVAICSANEPSIAAFGRAKAYVGKSDDLQGGQPMSLSPIFSPAWAVQSIPADNSNRLKAIRGFVLGTDDAVVVGTTICLCDELTW